MSVLSKVILGFFCVAAIVFFYLAARTLKTHDAFRVAYNSYHLEKIPKVEVAIEDLRHGNAEEKLPSLLDLKAELHKEVLGRGGRIWPGVQMTQVDPATGVATVTITAPTPHGLQEKAVVYAYDFETTPDAPGGKFLGEFRVTGVADAQVTLTPTYTASARELAKLAQAKTTWMLADAPAIDRRELFSGQTDDQLKAILPAETLDEYVRDRQPPKETDPAESVRVRVRITKSYEEIQKENPGLIETLGVAAENKQKLLTVGQVVEVTPEVSEILTREKIGTEEGRVFVRNPRDYVFIFQELHRQLAEITAANTTLAAHLAGLKKDLEDAANQKETYTQLIAEAKIELARSQKELSDVVAHRDALKAELAANSAELEATLAESKRLADEYAALQIAAIERVDALTAPAAE